MLAVQARVSTLQRETVARGKVVGVEVAFARLVIQRVVEVGCVAQRAM
jgi:hypothetical protein